MAFVPASEILGLAVVYPLGRRPVSFARAVDSFFAGNTVWLYWMSVFMVLGAAIAFWPVYSGDGRCGRRSPGVGGISPIKSCKSPCVL